MFIAPLLLSHFTLSLDRTKQQIVNIMISTLGAHYKFEYDQLSLYWTLTLQTPFYLVLNTND